MNSELFMSIFHAKKIIIQLERWQILMEIRLANENDIEILKAYDKHISKTELKSIVKLGRVFVMIIDGNFVGWLRYNLFWDNTPFMNMLFLLDDYRGKGYGKEMVNAWENKMKDMDYDIVMTSTASDEYAKHFYKKMGYMAVGGFIPLDEPLELIFQKKI
jgi:GNAT superfamily N-acetyltransferase